MLNVTLIAVLSIFVPSSFFQDIGIEFHDSIISFEAVKSNLSFSEIWFLTTFYCILQNQNRPSSKITANLHFLHNICVIKVNRHDFFSYAILVEDLNHPLLAEKNCQSSKSLIFDFSVNSVVFNNLWFDSYFSNFIAFSFFQLLCQFIVKRYWHWASAIF